MKYFIVKFNKMITAIIVAIFFVIVLFMMIYIFSELMENCDDSIWGMLFLVVVGGLWIYTAFSISIPKNETKDTAKTEEHDEDWYLKHLYISIKKDGVYILADTTDHPKYEMVIDTVYRKIN